MSDASVSRTHSVQYHTAVLVISCLILVLAFMLEVRENQQVAFRWGGGPPLPEICAMKTWLGLKCPACGLTRSFILLTRGSLWGSLKQHRLGWLLVLAVAIQIPYRIIALARGCDAPWGKRFPVIYIWSLLILLFANWIVGFFIDV